MKYIDEKLIDALMALPNDSSVKAVKEKLHRYEAGLSKELPAAAAKEIHIIGMVHSSSVEDVTQTAPNLTVIESQQRVKQLLEELNPDIVGIEGFCGAKFSVEAMIDEYQKIWNVQIPIGALTFRMHRLLNDPQTRSIFDYQKQHPKIIFCGVEFAEISTLQQMILFGTNTGNRSLEKYVEYIGKLRSLMMILKLGRHMKNLGKAKAALPVGFMHLPHFSELKDHLSANWTIQNTVAFLNSDLTP